MSEINEIKRRENEKDIFMKENVDTFTRLRKF